MSNANVLADYGYAPASLTAYRPFINVTNLDPFPDGDASPVTQLLALAAMSVGFHVGDVDDLAAALYSLLKHLRSLLPPSRRAISRELLRDALRFYMRNFCPSIVLPPLASVHGASVATLQAVLCEFLPPLSARRASRSAAAQSLLQQYSEQYDLAGRSRTLMLGGPKAVAHLPSSFAGMSQAGLNAGALGPLSAVLERAVALVQAGAPLPLKPLQIVPLPQPAPDAEIRVLRMAQCAVCGAVFSVASDCTTVPVHGPDNADCVGSARLANKVLEFVDYSKYV